MFCGLFEYCRWWGNGVCCWNGIKHQHQ
jgi:hypothetical protein